MLTPEQTREELATGLEIGWNLTTAMSIVTDVSNAGYQDVQAVIATLENSTGLELAQLELAEGEEARPFARLHKANMRANAANQHAVAALPLAESMAAVVTAALVGDDEGAPKTKTNNDRLDKAIEALRLTLGEQLNHLPYLVLNVGTRAVHASAAVDFPSGALSRGLQPLVDARSVFADVSAQSGLVVGTVRLAYVEVNNYLSRLDLDRLKWPPGRTEPRE
jgi:hypothetical protein